MNSESPDLGIILLSKKEEDHCVIFSEAGKFLYERSLLKDTKFFPEKEYSSFYSPFPYSYLQEVIGSCTSIVLKNKNSHISNSPVSVIACGGDIGYEELGQFNP